MRSLLLLSFFVLVSNAQVDPRNFAVMAWGESPTSEEKLRGMREAGLNISGFCHTEDLEKVRAAGLSCFVQSPAIDQIDWLNPPPDATLRTVVERLRGQIAGNPAALGVFLRDEPNAPMMPALGKLSSMLKESMPGLWPYVNLFPYRVSAARLGTSDYDSYVRMLVGMIHQPFLSYDNYSLVGGEMLDYFYINLEIVRRLSMETHTPFWNCILANTHFNYMEPSDATFHLQVYASLAYGARGIQYFTYYSPAIGNFRLGALDQFGNRTTTWEMLRRVNNELQTLAPTMIGLHSTGVFHYPAVPEQGQPLSASKLVESVELTQRFVRSPAGGRFLIGEFEDDRHRPYFLFVNKDLNNSFQLKIHLRRPEAKLLQVSQYTGKEQPFAGEMEWIAPGGGVLFRVDLP
jgi:hypothetical protein